MYLILKRFNKKKKTAIFTGIILILAAIPLSVYSYNSYNYEKYFNAGLDNLKNEKFENAKNDFNNALRFNKNSKEDINKKIAQVEVMYKAKQTYEEGLSKFNDGKFIDAAVVLQKVPKEYEKYYKMAQNKIIECKKTYANQNISNAKAKDTEKNYTEAIKILDTVIDFDKDNYEALELKNEYNASIQKLKEDDNKASVESAKQLVSVNTDTNISRSNVQSASGEYPKIIYLSNGVHIIENKQQDDGHLGGAIISCRTIIFADQPRGIYFTLITGGQAYYQNVTYKAIFHFSGQDYVYNGVASSDMQFVPIPSGVIITPGTIVKADFQVNYKGKIYNFSAKATS